MKREFLRLCRRLVPVLVLFAAACASLYGLKAPEVSLSDVTLSGGTLLEQRFKLKLRVLNPNDRDITISGLTFQLDIGDKRFASGATGQTVVLPRLGDTVVEVDATAQMLSLIQQLPKLVNGEGKVPYRVKGDVVTTDYGRIPFDRKGETTLPWAQPPTDSDSRSL